MFCHTHLCQIYEKKFKLKRLLNILSKDVSPVHLLSGDILNLMLDGFTIFQGGVLGRVTYFKCNPSESSVPSVSSTIFLTFLHMKFRQG